MDKANRTVKAYYSYFEARGGDDGARLGWHSNAGQAKRFADLTGLLEQAVVLRGAEVHDVGCGHGAYVPWAFRHGAHSYLGSDIRPEIVVEARRRHAGQPNVRFETLDATRDVLPACDLGLAIGTLAYHTAAHASAMVQRLWNSSRWGIGLTYWIALTGVEEMAAEGEKIEAFLQGFKSGKRAYELRRPEEQMAYLVLSK